MRKPVLNGISAIRPPAFAASEIMAVRAAPDNAMPVSELSSANGRAAKGIERSAGRSVTVWGYLSATATPRVYLLSEESAAYCQMCGISHAGGPSVMLRCRDDSFVGVSDIEPVVAEGRISLRTMGGETFFDPQVELLEASRPAKHR